MYYKCNCKVNTTWPFLVSYCKHGNQIEKKKSDVDAAKREEQQAKIKEADVALF